MILIFVISKGMKKVILLLYLQSLLLLQTHKYGWVDHSD